MACRQCQGIEDFFDEGVARRELRRYRRRGPSRTTRLLLEALVDEGVEGRTFLDVGGGVGAIQHELMARGARGGTHADASPSYLEAARSEAERRGREEAVRFVHGDFVEMAEEVPPADLVTLDRVVCCYPDMEGLVDATASRARRAYGLVFPRVNLLTRLGFRLLNLVQRLRGHPFHVFLHDTDAVEDRVRTHGLEKRVHRHTILWQILVFAR
jgi:magnesium-protoporphyrin O-methyltransferase